MARDKRSMYNKLCAAQKLISHLNLKLQESKTQKAIIDELISELMDVHRIMREYRNSLAEYMGAPMQDFIGIVECIEPERDCGMVTCECGQKAYKCMDGTAQCPFCREMIAGVNLRNQGKSYKASTEYDVREKG